MTPRPCSSILWVSTAAAAGVFAVPGQASALTCDRLAASWGSDNATGSYGSPYRTAQRLSNALRPGETGCLAAGQTFVENLRVANGGTPGAPIRITSSPGGRATLRGRLWVTPSGHDVAFENLVLDGRNSGGLASPEVSADRVAFRYNDVSNSHTGICFALGKTESAYAAVAHDLVLEGNRIHNCGVLPRTNGDHGIYVESTRNARIFGNWIYDNADRGVQLFPDAQGTIVERNVIDGNGVGVIFSGWRSWSSSNNVVRNNVITNSVARHNVEAYWDGVPPGTGNVAADNCVFNGSGSYGDGNIGPQNGFTASGNVVVNPGYGNRAAKDFSVPEGSVCADKVPPPLPPPVLGTPASPGGSAAASGSAGSSASGQGAGLAAPGVRAPRRYVRGRWMPLRLAPSPGAARVLITRSPRLSGSGRRTSRPAGIVRVPLPRRDGPVTFTVRYLDASGRPLGGAKARVIVDRTPPRLGLRRSRGGRIVRLTARDPHGIRRIRVGGAMKRTLTPRRPTRRVSTRLRLPRARTSVSVVAFDRAGNATVRRRGALGAR